MASTLFTKVDYTLSALTDDVAHGKLALPDIQRPFVWKNVKVRDLFDSMYRGYPVGYLLFWETGAQPGTRQIGADTKQLVPSRLIVDGQQRLTSLYAVIKGIPVVRENFTTEKIEIAFNPLDGKFAVPDAAIRRDKRFIPSISAIWNAETNLIEFSSDYVDELRKQNPAISAEDIKRAQSALGRLHALLHYPFTALELSQTVTPDQVSDVFVRVNSLGAKLNQSDFILTLMSVYWDEGRRELEDFSRHAKLPSTGGASPFNHLIQPTPDQLLRVAIAVGFRRGRLSAVYAVLRGKDTSGATVSGEAAVDHFDHLKSGQAAALKVQYWHDFLHCVRLAGYRSAKLVSSANSIIFAYAFYLIGRTQFGVEEHALRKVIAKWLFMSNVTGRFTSSPESALEFDLARLRNVTDAHGFIDVIDQVCASTLTGDFWSITLPNDLATTAARSPSMFAFFAALNVLDARALYSLHTVRELMDPSVKGTRSSLERHHLFPVAYLKTQGIEDQRDYNQIANFAIMEWGDNGAISDSAPPDYVPAMEARFDPAVLSEMYRAHALPYGWQNLSFNEFLRQRRSLMAATIKRAYDVLAGNSTIPTAPPPITDLIAGNETDGVEFKSTLRINLHTGEKDPRMETAVLKTIAGFLNSHGGTLIVGVADDGSAVGIGRDQFENEDKMALHLVSLMKERLGGQNALNVHLRFEDFEGERVLTVECDRALAPTFVKDGPAERFFVRYGPSTQELVGAAAQAYIAQRFG